ncbi:MAG: pseudouridine-5-phosphate glycosidase [Candidatus Cloacimonetes bacterium HGW-Cloacimonetes-1]|jgi:pseudouridine-5'-phosphate glycosidase|nr:MAG: pseudouridine-5-phosphate glycosidase [Candidatus Cloacimonetes bacterium HGW-Cloacimonetes-1]
MKELASLPIQYSTSVAYAISNNLPIVALESTVITHGLPYPQNIELMRSMEQTIIDKNATPATIILIDGTIHVGIDEQQILQLKNMFEQKKSFTKLSMRDLPLALAQKISGGTTVSATMYVAHLAGIKVFATGGIGGVHRDWSVSLDISTDLLALSQIPVIVVSAGCKAILDIKNTMEQLESLSVPVYGWQTSEFPAFYSRSSGNTIPRVDSITAIAASYHAMLALAQATHTVAPGILIANPIDLRDEIPSEQIEPYIVAGISAAKASGIHGKELTPFLLSYLAESTQGRSVTANLSLLLNNASLAADIAIAVNRG